VWQSERISTLKQWRHLHDTCSELFSWNWNPFNQQIGSFVSIFTHRLSPTAPAAQFTACYKSLDPSDIKKRTLCRTILVYVSVLSFAFINNSLCVCVCVTIMSLRIKSTVLPTIRVILCRNLWINGVWNCCWTCKKKKPHNYWLCEHYSLSRFAFKTMFLRPDSASVLR
jgi:hypothetical protein